MLFKFTKLKPPIAPKFVFARFPDLSEVLTVLQSNVPVPPALKSQIFRVSFGAIPLGILNLSPEPKINESKFNKLELEALIVPVKFFIEVN